MNTNLNILITLFFNIVNIYFLLTYFTLNENSSMVKLPSEPKPRKEMVENGYEAVNPRFNMNLIKEDLIWLYDELQAKLTKP